MVQLSAVSRNGALVGSGPVPSATFTAEGISTLFNGRDDLFNDLPLNLEDFEPLYAQPLTNSIRLDGQTEDWGPSQQLQYLQFGSLDGVQDADFEMLLGERADFLYVYMRIRDQSVVYRDPEYLRLDNADHIQLNFIRADGEDGRVSLVFPVLECSHRLCHGRTMALRRIRCCR